MTHPESPPDLQGESPYYDLEPGQRLTLNLTDKVAETELGEESVIRMQVALESTSGGVLVAFTPESGKVTSLELFPASTEADGLRHDEITPTEKRTVSTYTDLPTGECPDVKVFDGGEVSITAPFGTGIRVDIEDIPDEYRQAA